jgi:hypothetical protein
VESRQPQVSLFGLKRSLLTQESNPRQADQIELRPGGGGGRAFLVYLLGQRTPSLKPQHGFL